jgi:hypothetical protein
MLFFRHYQAAFHIKTGQSWFSVRSLVGPTVTAESYRPFLGAVVQPRVKLRRCLAAMRLYFKAATVHCIGCSRSVKVNVSYWLFRKHGLSIYVLIHMFQSGCLRPHWKYTRCVQSGGCYLCDAVRYYTCYYYTCYSSSIAYNTSELTTVRDRAL